MSLHGFRKPRKLKTPRGLFMALAPIQLMCAFGTLCAVPNVAQMTVADISLTGAEMSGQEASMALLAVALMFATVGIAMIHSLIKTR